MELHEALSQITEIRQQMARSSVFRGYRSATTTFSGLAAIGTAIIQSQILPEPAKHTTAYLWLWIGAAAISLVVVAAEIILRAKRSNSALQRDLSTLAIEQFFPSVVAGGLLTAVLARYASGACWMLPGLWSILFGLGVFASCRVLPRAMFWVGGFYLQAGLGCLILAQDTYDIFALGDGRAVWGGAADIGGDFVLHTGAASWRRIKQPAALPTMGWSA